MKFKILLSLSLLVSILSFSQTGNNHLKLAKQKQKAGNSKSALKHYNQALQEDSSLNNSAVFFFDRGNCKMNIKDYKGAISDYTTAITLNEFYVDAYYNRGTCRMSRKQYKEAIKDFDKSIEMYPEDKDSFLNRAFCKRKVKDNNGALKDYNKAIQYGPKDGDAFYERALFKLYLGDFTGACHDFDRANNLGIWEAEEKLQEYCRY